jgi:hypothetical protein
MTRARLAILLTAIAAAIAVVSFGSPAAGTTSGSLSKKIRALQRQVAAIQKQQGPPGTNGAPGAPGTARAYGLITPDCVGSTPAFCPFHRARGITSVTRPFAGTGQYCITTPDIIANESVPVVSVDWGSTGSPESNAVALAMPSCSLNSFSVLTERNPTGAAAEDVGFTIVIP